MKITNKNNVIQIIPTESLKKYQISQLEYYGYSPKNNQFEKKTNDLVSDLQKLTTYLTEELISYDLSEDLLTKLNKSAQERMELNSVFLKAKGVKEQTDLSNDTEFSEFKTFIDNLPRKLKPHQIRSAFHFYILKNGANFSVPGSGKTSTILSVFEKFRLEGKCNLLFIVGPPSCFHPWKHEFYETLGRAPNSIILSGGDKASRKNEYYRSKENAFELYLTTFNTVLNDTKEILYFFSQVGINAFLVIDEAHYIKQLGGSWSNSVLEIGKNAKFKGVLTGTPIPKSYKDLFNLFDFLWGSYSPLSDYDKILIEDWEKKQKIEEVKTLLNLHIGPLFYRVNKKELGLIPAIHHTPIVIKMNPIERKIYNSIKMKILDLTQFEYFKNEDILNNLWKGRMMRLRQAISYPGLLTSVIDGYNEKLVDDSELQNSIRNYNQLEISGKLIALNDLVIDLRKKGNKVLIWSNFIGTLKIIKSHFNSIGERSELIYGKTPIRRDDSNILSDEKTREDIRDEFLNLESGLNILIANPAACAESISLHKTCFHAIYFDLSYNAAHYLQSLDRIHRVGGSEKNQANYYFLQYENSIDQDIKTNLEKKIQKMYEIIEQDYDIYDLDLYDEGNDDDVSAYKRLFRKSSV